MIPMQIDCMRKQIWNRCKGKGHTAKVYPCKLKNERRRIYNIVIETDFEGGKI